MTDYFLLALKLPEGRIEASPEYEYNALLIARLRRMMCCMERLL